MMKVFHDITPDNVYAFSWIGKYFRNFHNKNF
jgi:hypothetical protein